MSSAAPRRAAGAPLAPNAPPAPAAPSAAAKAVAAVAARASSAPPPPAAAAASSSSSSSSSAAAALDDATSVVLRGAQLLKLPFSRAGAPDARVFRVFRAAAAPADAIVHDGDGLTDFGAGEIYLGYRSLAGAAGGAGGGGGAGSGGGAAARVGGLLGKLAAAVGAGVGGGGGAPGSGSGDRWSLHPLSCASWVRQGDAGPVFSRCRAKGLLVRGHGLPPVEAEVSPVQRRRRARSDETAGGGRGQV